MSSTERSFAPSHSFFAPLNPAPTPHLHQAIAEQVSSWQELGFASDEYPAIAEILDHQVIINDSGTRERRYLRSPQIEALCTYWWLRLRNKTAHVLDLYRSSFSTNRELLESLGLRTEAITDFLMDHDIEELWKTIRADDAFAGLAAQLEAHTSHYEIPKKKSKSPSPL